MIVVSGWLLVKNFKKYTSRGWVGGTIKNFKKIALAMRATFN
jgi:hypothetical protein